MNHLEGKGKALAHLIYMTTCVDGEIVPEQQVSHEAREVFVLATLIISKKGQVQWVNGCGGERMTYIIDCCLEYICVSVPADGWNLSSLCRPCLTDCIDCQ